MWKREIRVNVFSGFDGMSCGQLALKKAGFKVKNYYASEIEKASIEVTQYNFPGTIQLGDICKIDASKLPKFKLAMAGSPCQDLSGILGEDGEGLDGNKSRLFFEFVRILKEAKPEYFLLENVEMKKEYEDIISGILGVKPVRINSNLFAPQNRPRLYWTNIEIPPLPTEECNFALVDIMEPIEDIPAKEFYNVDFTYHQTGSVAATLHFNHSYQMTKRCYRDTAKSPCLTVISGGGHEKKIMQDFRPRKMSPLEYERAQTVPDNYTNVNGMIPNKRRSMLGNGWTVDVIAHILSGMK
jgi:site-specific DNA-cytosine methylase